MDATTIASLQHLARKFCDKRHAPVVEGKKKLWNAAWQSKMNKLRNAATSGAVWMENIAIPPRSTNNQMPSPMRLADPAQGKIATGTAGDME